MLCHLHLRSIAHYWLTQLVRLEELSANLNDPSTEVLDSDHFVKFELHLVIIMAVYDVPWVGYCLSGLSTDFGLLIAWPKFDYLGTSRSSYCHWVVMLCVLDLHLQCYLLSRESFINLAALELQCCWFVGSDCFDRLLFQTLNFKASAQDWLSHLETWQDFFAHLVYPLHVLPFWCASY